MKTIIINILLLSVVFTACKKTEGDKYNGFQSSNNLTIASGLNMGEQRVTLSPDSIYSDINSGPLFKALPAGFDNNIASFDLPKGYMVVFAENNDGSGESSCYVASKAPIRLNFSPRLRDKVSYIRYIPIDNPSKKGVAFTDSNVVKQFNTSWYYGWSINRPSFGPMNFIPMTWGKGTATVADVNYLVGRKDINHLLSFNEPDNSGQSNIASIDTAIARYRIMMQTGLRLGSPAVEQNNAFVAGKWLPMFMDSAKAKKLRIDYVCLHWYDWGNENSNTGGDTLVAEQVFTRFKAYVERARLTYPDQKLWLTEYNCNPSRNARPNLIKYFMQLSSEWLNTVPYVERYAYFQTRTGAVDANGNLNDLAKFWNSLPSPPVFPVNID
ncbi:glycosyl hydrolase [Lacibacter sp. H375]|uniref:glycosyl hydrolase n=1 Tax=Lacibacter sp. H375 TaxID=3133424 RepID=UPI0030BE12B1